MLENSSQSSQTNEEVSDFDCFVNTNDVPQPVTDWSSIQSFFRSHISDEKTRRYLADEHRGPTIGARMLVKRAFDSPDGNLPSTDETYFHLLMSCFLLSLTESQRETFFVLVQVIYDNAVLQCQKSNGIFNTGTTRMPTCRDDFLRFYLQKNHSIIKSLPHPPVTRNNHETHAFTEYFDTIQHYLAMGKVPFDTVAYCRDNEVVPERYADVMNQYSSHSPTYVVMVDEWRDKFDGNTSKQNRSSVLANTTTVVGANESYSTSNTDTFPQCIGSGADSSTSAESHLAESLATLLDGITWFYSPIHRALVPCVVMFRSSIQDRVERSAFTYHLSHSSPLCRRWGYAGPFDLRGLNTCTRCYRSRVSFLSRRVSGPSDMR